MGVDLVVTTSPILMRNGRSSVGPVMSASCCNHSSPASAPAPDARYRRILWMALAINLTMFFVEIVASFRASSVSLRADALDFLGDAANYALALAVFGLALRWRAAAEML